MTERTLAVTVMKALSPWDRVRVENPAHPGTPDVNYCEGEGLEGWIELKHAPRWPKRAKSKLRMDHFTQQQRVWLTRRDQKGGTVWVLLQVDKEYLLFAGATAATILGHVSREELFAAAEHTWESKRELEQQLRQCLSRQRT